MANPYFATGSTSFFTYVKRYFYDLIFSTAGAINEDDPVTFTFRMDRDHETGKYIPETVDVYLTGLVPDYDNPLFVSTLSGRFQNVQGNHYVYSTEGETGINRLYLLSTGETPNYAVTLKAQYYEDATKTNVPNEFTGLNFTSSVLYGRGWPTTFQFTIPDSYEMPASGSIDIELNLTNLVPNDANITESGGKYYYRATSKGTKTLNLKTAGSQTASVTVELIHVDFIPASQSQTERNYLNIAANTFTMTYSTAPQNNNTPIYICSNKNLSNQLTSFNKNNSNKNTEISFDNTYLDYDQKLYMWYSRSNTYYYATTTAGTLYGGGTVAFSTLQPGRKQITVNTTKTNYTNTSDKTHTEDGVYVGFSSLNSVSDDRVDMTDPSTVTISAPDGYHLVSANFTYYRSSGLFGLFATTYYPGSVTINSGDGSYSNNNGSNNNTTGTWTSSNSSTDSVTLYMTGRNGNRVAIVSIVVIIEED